MCWENKIKCFFLYFEPRNQWNQVTGNYTQKLREQFLDDPILFAFKS